MTRVAKKRGNNGGSMMRLTIDLFNLEIEIRFDGLVLRVLPSPAKRRDAVRRVRWHGAHVGPN